MIQNLTLTEDTASIYFAYIFKKESSGDKYPVDFDEVWPLGYKSRSKALQQLRKNFLEPNDYGVFTQTVQNSSGGRPRQRVRITTSCLEYFIVRKKREVFDVYREARRKLQQIALKPKSQAELILDLAQQNLENERRLTSVEESVKQLEAKSNTEPMFYAVVGYASLIGEEIDLKTAASIGRKASKVCKDLGIKKGTIPDPRFGKVYTYPKSVLKELFNKII